MSPILSFYDRTRSTVLGLPAPGGEVPAGPEQGRRLCQAVGWEVVNRAENVEVILLSSPRLEKRGYHYGRRWFSGSRVLAEVRCLYLSIRFYEAPGPCWAGSRDFARCLSGTL